MDDDKGHLLLSLVLFKLSNNSLLSSILSDNLRVQSYSLHLYLLLLRGGNDCPLSLSVLIRWIILSLTFELIWPRKTDNINICCARGTERVVVRKQRETEKEKERQHIIKLFR